MTFGVITPRGIMLSAKEFESLPDYSCSLPTGTYVGKRWRRRCPYRYEVDDPAAYTYWMGEYVASLIPGEIGIEWTQIILPDGYVPIELQRLHRIYGVPVT